MRLTTKLLSVGISVGVFYTLHSGYALAPSPDSDVGQSAPWGWQLPCVLSDTNTKTIFEVDSTWHLVKGTTSGVEGRAWLADPRDPLSVRASLSFPVARFNTDWESRDARLREVMDNEHVPNVRVALESFVPQCDAQAFQTTGECTVELKLKLAIRNNERPLTVQGTMRRETQAVALRGVAHFSWRDFGVEDPSILIAKLDPDMTVTFEVSVPAISAR